MPTIALSDTFCLCCPARFITESRNSRSRRTQSVVLALPLKNDAFLETSRRIEGRILCMDVLSPGCNIRLCHEIGCGTCPRPPANAGGDRFLGGGMFLSVPLRYRLDVCALP